MSETELLELRIGDLVYHTFFRESYRVYGIDKERSKVMVKDPSLKGRACIRTYEIRFLKKL